MNKKTMDDLNDMHTTTWNEGLQLLIWGWGQEFTLDNFTAMAIAEAVRDDLESKRDMFCTGKGDDISETT